MSCPICREGPLGLEGEFPIYVCEDCDKRAVNKDGDTPWTGYPPEKQAEIDESSIVEPPDDGENPVFIDGHKCWRRYRFGGWVTYLDSYDCDTIREFYVRHGKMEPRESRQRITPTDQSQEEHQRETDGSSLEGPSKDEGAINVSNSNSNLEFTDEDKEELLNQLIEANKITPKSEANSNNIQQISELVGDSPWSSLAIRYLVMVAIDDPDLALDALPTVSSVYSVAKPEVREWIMYYFTCLSKTHPEALLPVLDTLIDGISGENTNIQSNALVALGRISKEYPNTSAGLVDDVAELLVHDNSGIRTNAVGLLGDIAEEYQRHVVVHTATIAACLRDDEPHVRRNASIALVTCGEADPDAIRKESDHIEYALTDEQPEVRKNMCVLIGNAKPDVSSNNLEQLVQNEPNTEVKKMAQWALDQIDA